MERDAYKARTDRVALVYLRAILGLTALHLLKQNSPEGVNVPGTYDDPSRLRIVFERADTRLVRGAM